MFETSSSARDMASSATWRTRFNLHLRFSAITALFVGLLATPALSPPAFATTLPPSGGAVVDYSSGFNASTPAALKKAGVGIVIRYVGSSAWKCLTPAEAIALRGSGIDIAAVYESDASWMLGGRSAGIAAAQAARAAIISDGGPARPFVYFACDTDTSDFSAVNAALLGAQTVLGAENVGIYGSYSVCSSALKAGTASKAWQTVAWSNGQVLPGATLLQLIPQTLGDLGVDYDSNVRYTSDVGQWGVTLRSAGLPSGPAASQSGAAVPTSQAPPAVEVVRLTPQVTPTTAKLRAIESTNGVSAWAVGDEGTILHTESAGTTWAVQSTPASTALEAVHFVDGREGWAAGKNGTVFHTFDGGQAWYAQSTPTSDTLTSISFADAENGWAVGEDGTVLHTDNGGFNWSAQSAPTTATLYSVKFSSDTTGVAVGEGGAFLFTGNGGKSWFQASTPTTSTLSAYCGIDPTVAWSVGASGTVLSTANDGATWAVRPVPTTSALQDLVFADPSRGMAVGASGTVLFTQDAGQTWARQSGATTATLNGVALVGTKGWVVGDNGKVLRVQLESTP